MLKPVRLPPGRARLATRPAATGSLPPRKTIGIVEVALFAASAEGVAARRHDHVDLAADEIGGQGGQPIIMALRPAVFDRHVLSLDIAGFAQSLPERGQVPIVAGWSGDAVLRKPITGIAFCCARKASGHAVAAPPSRMISSRRLTSLPRPASLRPAGTLDTDDTVDIVHGHQRPPSTSITTSAASCQSTSTAWSRAWPRRERPRVEPPSLPWTPPP